MTQQTGTATMGSPQSKTFNFEVRDVTDSFTLTVDDVQPALDAGSVAQAVAARMSLPDSPWALRDDATAEFLADDRPIGEQIRPGASVTLTTKTHLGAVTGTYSAFDELVASKPHQRPV